MRIVFIASSYSHLILFNESYNKLSKTNETYSFVLNDNCKNLFSNSEPLKADKKSCIEKLEELNPEAIILDAADHYKVVASIIKWGKLNHIKTICLMDHRKRLDKDFQLLEKPDFILTPNKKVYNDYKNKSKVVLFKSFINEFVSSSDYKYEKTIDYENPDILYISQNNKPFYNYFLVNLYRKVIPKKHVIYIKEHYHDKKMEWGRFCAPYKKIDAEDIIEKMLSFDLIIGDNSELLFAASALGIPTIFMSLDYKEHFYNFFEKHIFEKHCVPDDYKGIEESFINQLNNVLKNECR